MQPATLDAPCATIMRKGGHTAELDRLLCHIDCVGSLPLNREMPDEKPAGIPFPLAREARDFQADFIRKRAIQRGNLKIEATGLAFLREDSA
ncbi:MAG TPA: hypothetical protein DDW14_01700, partial [Spirochaetaceae bacterium]|nr:hypothetical protein [Spirochaetaceae bacterium]